MDEREYRFPEEFLWGASISSHQVEGGNTNDWSEWENKYASQLAEESKGIYGYWQPWQIEMFPEMKDPSNYISGRACDHYNRFEEDFKLAKDLGHSAIRISIEWSRVEPEEGKFDEDEIRHYKKVISSLRELGIEPFVTVWHWTVPLWFRDKGGWENRGSVNFFIRYAEKMVHSLGSDVKFWITINEPEIYSSSGYYAKGLWPPEKKSFVKYFTVFHNLIKAHKLAYSAIKKTYPHSHVGVAKDNIYFEAYRSKVKNKIVATLADLWWNEYFLFRIRNHQDFIGLNHYFHNLIVNWSEKNENKIVSDLGWELYPESIYFVLKDLQKYGRPVYILENGLADAEDKKRSWYIMEILRHVRRAMYEGADVRGYLHWSLMDNFEWNKGFWPRFGLVEIDRKTLERRPRHSAEFYKDIILERGLTQKVIKKHEECCLRDIASRIKGEAPSVGSRFEE